MLGRNLFLLLSALSVPACQASGDGDGQPEPQEDGTGGNTAPDDEGEPVDDGEAEPSDVDAALPDDEETPGDAGKPGSPTADASTPTEPPRTPLDCKDRSFCWQFDDLKAGDRLPSQYGSQKLTGASKLFVDDAMAYSGKNALRVEGNPSGTAGASALLSFSVKDVWAKSKTLYVRMMIRPETTAPGDGHWDFFQLHGAVTGSPSYGAMVSYGGFGGIKAKLLYVGKPLSWADCSLSAQRFFLPNRWACLEVKIDQKDTSQAYSVSINGNPIHELTVGPRPAKSICVQGADGIAGHWKVPDIDSMALGYNHYHQQLAPHRFWLDDVVIDSKPVGCPAKP